MTARERVVHAQRLLGVGLAATALAWGGTIYFASLAIIAFATRFAKSTAATGQNSFLFALVLGVATAAVLLWRGRYVASAGRVALWIEERLPRLHYALISAIEPGLAGDQRALEQAVATENISSVTLAALRRAVLPAAGALILAAALLYVSPVSAFGRSTVFGGGRKNVSGAVTAESRLNGLKVEVVPPAYARQARRDLDDPASVRALVGSTIIVTGDGSSSGLSARLADIGQRVTAQGARWRAQLAMPEKPAALTLTDRSYEKVIVLEPQADEAPRVALVSPVRDTTVRVPQLVVQLHAETTDDIALMTGYFEYLITSGSSEIITGRTVTTPPVNFGGARTGALDAILSLASLKLSQGDVVSVRAIVRDANTLSGPSIGTSETRTFRVARADEYDSVAVEAAGPLPIDSTATSQRMLIAMAEKLVREQPKITRQELVKRSTEIGDLEDRIRKRVHEILFESQDLSGQKQQAGEPPAGIEEMEPADEITGLKNPTLTSAYNSLWEAVRSLQIAEPAPALPPMRAALKALDRARLANRLYLRGMPPKIVVDIQRVRLTGKDKGISNVRTPRSFADSLRTRLSARFNAAIDLIQSQPARAIRDLALIQVDAISSFPGFAAALADAAGAMRTGRDATLPLLRARRAIDGSPEATPGLPVWSGGG